MKKAAPQTRIHGARSFFGQQTAPKTIWEGMKGQGVITWNTEIKILVVITTVAEGCESKPYRLPTKSIGRCSTLYCQLMNLYLPWYICCPISWSFSWQRNLSWVFSQCNARQTGWNSIFYRAEDESPSGLIHPWKQYVWKGHQGLP